ncbi:ABC-type methionine transport system, substrate-binding protein [Maize bushy stunt phytoplasma]|uniref:ABC-type methionine transport system, substrate-binding protein n=1 Tax=Maize bushy stunt phytoplasma TaxID=202462 RepID=A0ABN4RZ15_9MOLU|nr:ABC transporter substrate-binding protein [Maize bushy stunt phytoplasma]AOF54959.1 ABC-type methionine transport system, substrate-binding protein [Maize bushy stunt phytoplasma]
MFKLYSLSSKTKKNLLFALLTISLLCNLLLGYFLWDAKKSLAHTPSNQKNHKLTVATALPTIKYFLEEYAKDRLKEYNIDLDVQYISSGFKQTNELLLNKKVDAKLDAHVHDLNIFNKENPNIPDQDKLTFSQVVYLAKFGLFAKPNTFNNLEGIQKNNHPNNLKILMPQDNFQRSLALRVLQELKIIEKINPERTLSIEEQFNLKTTDFKPTNLYPDIEYTTESNLMTITSRFLAPNDFDLCLNYPTLMGLGINNFISLGIMQKPTNLDDIIYSYTISLVTTNNNKNNWKIKILQDILKEAEAIEYMEKSQFATNFYMIPRQEVKQISKNIKDKYLGKTGAAPASN